MGEATGMKTAEREWFGYSDIQRYCGLSRWSVLRAIRGGELPASRVGTRVLVRRGDLDRFLESRAV